MGQGGPWLGPWSLPIKQASQGNHVVLVRPRLPKPTVGRLESSVMDQKHALEKRGAIRARRLSGPKQRDLPRSSACTPSPDPLNFLPRLPTAPRTRKRRGRTNGYPPGSRTNPIHRFLSSILDRTELVKLAAFPSRLAEMSAGPKQSPPGSGPQGQTHHPHRHPPPIVLDDVAVVGSQDRKPVPPHVRVLLEEVPVAG